LKTAYGGKTLGADKFPRNFTKIDIDKLRWF